MPKDIAESVIAELEEQNPRLLAELAREKMLADYLQDKAVRFWREFSRLSKLRGEGEDIYTLEEVMPILLEVPPAEWDDRYRLSRLDRKLVKEEVNRFLDRNKNGLRIS